MKAMSCIRPLHSGQASTSIAKTFWSRSAQGTRYLRAIFAGFARSGFSVILAGVSGAAGTGSGAAGRTLLLTLEFGANTPWYLRP